jgi:hypothetical protein
MSLIVSFPIREFRGVLVICEGHLFFLKNMEKKKYELDVLRLYVKADSRRGWRVE